MAETGAFKAKENSSGGQLMSLEPLLISFDTAAEMLGIGRSLLYQMNADGRLGLVPHKLGRRSLLNRKELESWTDAGMPPRSQWNKIK